MPFKPDFKPLLPEADDNLWFVMHDGKMLVKEDSGAYSIPLLSDINQNRRYFINEKYFGLLDGCPCYIAEWKDDVVIDDGFELKGIGELFSLFGDDLILVAGCAAQLIRWNQTHRYCGQCGKLMEDKTDERARICPQCDLIYYPRLSPAIIVAVIKDNRILLARSGRFPTGFYSVLAGFVEPGETLEECVAREVYEEVGIVVKNIRYFNSQPWPFPDSLMLGFTAEYADGQIQIDQSEIAEASWYSADNFPNIPPRISIARHLIDWYVERYGNEKTQTS